MRIVAWTKIIRVGVAAVIMSLATAAAASASTIYWADWTGSYTGGPFTGNATITTPTTTVNVTYTNPAGIAFYQTSGGTDWWTDSTHTVRDNATSPFTSSQVDNIPTYTDIVALQFAGNQTLSFSTTIANPVFSYISLNGNGYAFLDQDFTILSFGDPSNGNACGWWGCGTSFKNVVNLGNGHIEYQLLGTGEPHGTIQFNGAFSTLTWRSLSNEYWNGFTVGVQGTAEEVFPGVVPEPSTMVLLGSGFVALAATMRRRRA